MNTGSSKKLKRVLDAVPAGYLVDASWLTGHGIAYESFRDYVKSGWLNRVARGVFIRPEAGSLSQDLIDWKACLLSMQHIMRRNIHVGGVSALALQGYSHYLPLGGNASVWVYGVDIPNWLSKLPLNAEIVTRRTSLFNDPTLGLTETPGDISDVLARDWQLVMSTPERAILEALDELPDQESFHNIDMIFEGLTTLRPRALKLLLAGCRKIKVKRLFFVFADKHNHAWRKRLDAQEFDLGSGDRALVKGGRIHPTYRIMVPEDFVGAEPSDGP